MQGGQERCVSLYMICCVRRSPTLRGARASISADTDRDKENCNTHKSITLRLSLQLITFRLGGEHFSSYFIRLVVGEK